MFMLFSLARLQAVILPLLFFSSFSIAKEESLFTSSVTYCEPPESLLVQQFDIAYFAKNQSVSFNVSVASVQANVNVTANLLLNVYGIRAVNITIDLCTIFGGALCPLPMYNFTGSDSISLPSSLGVQDRIPGIAFKIPDLEGVAQLVLAEVGTGKVKACVQATLSNGWSTHQTSVEWVTGGIALAALLLAIWHSHSPEAVLPFRFIDLLFLYQSIASSSFLSLNYPSTYRAFTLNFAWAMGLFSTSSTSSFQPSIDRMRHLTGGNLANATSASAVGLVNRKYSPYNLIGSTDPTAQADMSLIRRANDFSSALTNFLVKYPSSIRSTLNSATQGGDVQTVTTTSSNVLQPGIPIYVNTLHIATANAFMTTFLCSLILIASAVAMLLLTFITFSIVGRLRKQDHKRFRSMYMPFFRAWSIRISFVLFLPITVFSFYQWTLKDSWLSILLSVIAFLVILLAILFPGLHVLRHARREGRHALFGDADQLASNGPLYGQYRMARYFFVFPLLFAVFLKAIFIAFAKGNGEVQIILMVILEGFTTLLYLVLRPHRTRGGDIFSTFLAIIRLICSGLMIAFIERLDVAPIPRTVIGLVIAVIFSVAVLVSYINLILNSGVDRVWKRGQSKQSSMNTPILGDGSLEKGHGYSETEIEKGDEMISPSSSSRNVLRPANPTPESSDNLSPYLLQPYPVSPTETELTTSNRTSGTLTVGSLLPRRWSFSPLNSPIGSTQTHEPSSFASTNLPRHSNTPSLQHGHT